ncbi:hypothetical protein ACLKA6_007347 [Drosophila palustris]
MLIELNGEFASCSAVFDESTHFARYSFSRYDLMAGVTRAESFFSFNSGDVQYGIEADRRSRILKAYVRNTYTFHLNEIFATIVNEYTDWERPVQHPINIRDETLEALSDAQVVAPAAQTVDLHSADHRNSYLYVFDYQTRFGDYPQRQGCIHGEDLPYIFGAPLVGGLNHFTRNYTKTEISLSEVVMFYWSNFVRTGNPNEQMETEHGSRQERSRYKTIEWTAYESVHKKYLNFDTKPKLKNHYRAHRLSFWLNLIPDLHKPGGDNVPAAHHQLHDDDDLDNNIANDASVKPLNPSYTSRGANAAAMGNFTIFTNQVFSLLNLSSPSSSLQRNGTRYSGGKIYPDDMLDAEHAGGAASASQDNDGFAAYSTALSVTIAIGCSLLILNVLIFAGVYYQRDKTRLSEPRTQTKLKRQENGQMPNNICGDLETLTIHAKSDPATILSHHHAMQHHQLPPPEFADIPHRAPPPPKHMKSSMQDAAGQGGGSGGGGMLPPPHALQVLGNQCGTLTKKSCMKQTQAAQAQQQQQQQHSPAQQQQQHVVTHQQHQQHQQHLQNHHNQSMTTVLTTAGGLMPVPTPPTVPVIVATTAQQHQQQQQSQQQQQQQQQHPLMDELRV